MTRTRLLKHLFIALAAAGELQSQTRSLARDSTLNNLAHAPGTPLVAAGTLGTVVRRGAGPRAMILIPGLGFGASVFESLSARQSADYTTWAVTLPGFAGTPPLPMPADGGYAAAQWTESAVSGIVDLMDQNRIARATLVAHWIHGTQIALLLATRYPDRFDGVVLIAGVAKSYFSSDTSMLNWSTARRAAYTAAMGSQWFRTVTRRTWDDQNFMPYDYAVDPLRAQLLWIEAATPSLPVWIRYLLEFYSLDVTAHLAQLRVPTLLIRPGLDDPAFFVDAGRPYMRDLLHDSWRGTERAANLRSVTISGARTFVWLDRPAEFDRVLEEFLATLRRAR